MKLQLIHAYINEDCKVSQLRIKLDASDYHTTKPKEMVEHLDGQLHKKLLSLEGEQIQFTFPKTNNSPEPTDQNKEDSELILEFMSDPLQSKFMEKQRHINVLVDLLTAKKFITFLTLFEKPLQFKLGITPNKQISAVHYRQGEEGPWQDAFNSSLFQGFTYKVYSNGIALTLEEKLQSSSPYSKEDTPLLGGVRQRSPGGIAPHSTAFVPRSAQRRVVDDPTIPSEFETVEEPGCSCNIL